MSKTASQVRSSFLDFFESKDHKVCPSSPLVTKNDPTLVFVNAGMVQFKDVFTGRETRDYKRATSSQKCIRISGKHNDLENVGVTARHHTFFEMLGNFSFGDYFKESAIVYAWEFLTKTLGLPEERLMISIFGGEQGVAADEDAFGLWKKVSGLSDDRIARLGWKDNFWQMGDTGPCGPCTEIHFFTGDDPDVGIFGNEPGADGRGWMEIWNLVFMQYNREKQGDGYALTPLPAPSVDTGAGLERLSSVVQGKSSNYDTDLLASLVEKAASIAGKPYGRTLGDDDVSMRVIADHARTTAFLIAEGVFPDRAEKEYVLRRVMRRAIRHGHRLGIKEPFFADVALEVVEQMGGHYQELRDRKDLIRSVTEQEEIRFRETLERGIKLLDEEIATVRAQGKTEIAGETVFKLYDTFGFPKDLTEVIAQERSVTVDHAGFDRALETQRARSEGSKVGQAEVGAVWHKVAERLGATTTFTGYEHESGHANVLAIVAGAAEVDAVSQGEAVGFMVVDTTPFYAESGGQVGDAGSFTFEGGRGIIRDTQKPVDGLIVHEFVIEDGTLTAGMSVELLVDAEKRTATRRNHSATHLLHWALRKVLGPQSTQKGSLVGPSRLRFDFSHTKAVTPAELTEIEDLVNAKILTAAPVLTQVMTMDDAKKSGAMAIFEEKYGNTVRVLTMTQDSIELCGGTHARSLGEIGSFKILSESGVAAGVRRIEGVTGLNALAHVRALETKTQELGRLLKAGPADLVEKLEKVLEKERAGEKEIAELKKKLAFGGSGAKTDTAKDTRDLGGGARAFALSVEGVDGGTLREMGEKFRDELGSSVVLVASTAAGKVSLVCCVSKDLTGRFQAGQIIRPVAQILGGSGGGRPDMAQAGGTDVTKVQEALNKFYEVVSAGVSAPVA